MKLTVVVLEADEGDAVRSLGYVHDSITRSKKLPDGKLATRSDYMCR